MRLRSLLFCLALLTLLLIPACSAGPAAVPSPSGAPTVAPTPAPATAAPAVGCTAVNAEPTPAAILSFPAVGAADYSRGPAEAPVTLIEYCDFQTPICLSMAAVASNLVYKHPDDLRFVFRPVPLASLDKSGLAVQAVLAADEQGHFWEMYDVLFQKNKQWSALSAGDFRAWLNREAVGLGLDGTRFEAALTSPETASRAATLFAAAQSAGLQSVPLVLINGKPEPLFAIDYPTLDSTISLIALGPRQFKSCPAFNLDPSRQYLATIHTVKGDIVVQLYADKAPLAVNSFIFLARNGWFDGVTFHRVIPGFVAQAGDPSGTGRGGPGYVFRDEVSPDLKYDRPGLVGMANSGPDTNGSQFFITFAPEAKLDGKYTIFGQVLQGMDVVESLTPRDPSQAANLPPGDKIINVTIEEK
jgi:cyclophilin family peptidyl-prolyl cis-trans isomerase/protein-disulfide isomerase